ncbi:MULTISPECIES: response regulator transcription factor [Actinosynnema]|uniref:response regulator transcription factor n=1 Tax=Actinosynnema TaxID=40566 RepID=UPI0020A2B70B|nr:helix-turn-helix transcriptional regulator [Actinosynnema pretiosum]MCP2095623.1 regulatory protein, luxR family [Actinosynnema pretiosum]
MTRTSARQDEVLALIARGMSSREIAESLAISPKTVESHLQRLFDRYGVRNRAGLVARWLSDSEDVYQRFVSSSRDGDR